MIDSIDTSGVGSGGTRNIGGNTLQVQDLEKEIGLLHNKETGLVFSSCYVANDAALQTLPKILGDKMVFLSD